MGRLADYCTWDALSPKDVDYLQKADAVIEAAKAFVEANNSVDGDEWSTYHALETAVGALLAAEGEE